MTNIDKEILENSLHKDFSAVKVSDFRGRLVSQNDIVLKHIISLYFVKDSGLTKHIITEIYAMVSKLKSREFKTKNRMSILKMFEVFWINEFDTLEDGSDNEERLIALIRQREDDENTKYPYKEALKDLAIYCRNFSYQICRLIFESNIRDFTSDDIKIIYDWLNTGARLSFDKKLNLYW